MTSILPQGAGSDSRPPITAQEWLRRNQKRALKHRGKWVAISSSGIVGKSDDFDDVYVQARKCGAYNPLVFRVPSGVKTKKVVSAKQ